MAGSRFTLIAAARRRSRARAWLVAVVFLGALAAAPVAAQNSGVRIVTDIPAAPAAMQRFRLATTPPPQEVLNEALKARGLPPLTAEGRMIVSRSGRSPVANDTIRAFTDPASGDAHLIPNMMELARAPSAGAGLPPERAAEVARRLIADPRLIPKDGTEIRAATPITIAGGAVVQPARGAPAGRRMDPKTVLTIVPAFRYVAGYRVYGTGSRAVVSLAGDGGVVGLLRRWRTAGAAETVRTTVTGDQVRSEILRQLRPVAAAPGTRVVVDKIVLAYYDGNAGYLQPVYRFEAMVTSGGDRPTRIRTAGYVPVAPPVEPIPDLAAKPAGDMPTAPRLAPPVGRPVKGAAGMATAANAAGGAAAGIITLGEYANRDWPNDSGYVSMSNKFYAGLTAGRIFGFNRPFQRTQWYEAHPFELIGSSSLSYMNAVNVAYTVPHGNWLLNTTLRNDSDFWFVTDIGTKGSPGFGAGTGGRLATWVIMSCEVIPSMYDRQFEINGSGNPYKAFDAWWPVFQGLHNAIGFRTVMFYPDDALQFGFGFDAAIGGDLNAAWFQEVAAYDGDDGTYKSDHLINAPDVHYDRAATMVDARNLGQSIYNITPQSKATTLWNFWMNN